MFNTGLSGSVFACLLVFINTIIFVIGTNLFLLGAFLKWSGLLNTAKSAFLDVIGQRGFDFIDTAIKIFMVTGVIIAAVSFVGLLGACFNSRLILIIYEFLVCLLFIANIFIFIVLVLKADSFETSIRNIIKNTVEDIRRSVIEGTLTEMNKNINKNIPTPLLPIFNQNYPKVLPIFTETSENAFCPIIAYAGITKDFKCCDLFPEELTASNNVKSNFIILRFEKTNFFF